MSNQPMETEERPSTNSTRTSDSSSSTKLLELWLGRIRVAQVAQYESEAYFDRRNLALGIPVLVASTVVGTSVFATLAKDPSTRIKIAIGFVSVVAAILSALQTFLRYSERSARHRAAAIKYSKLRREIEQQLTFGFADQRSLLKFVTKIRKQWDAINEESMDAPKRLFLRIYSEQRRGSDQNFRLQP